MHALRSVGTPGNYELDLTCSGYYGSLTQATFFITHTRPSSTLYNVLVSKSNYRNINIVLIVLSGACDSNTHFKP
jgi:hypothetical protein